MQPKSNKQELPLDAILSALTTNDTNPRELSQEKLEAYRLQLAQVKKIVGAKMAETSTKDHFYDDDMVTQYIDDVLYDAFNLQETALSDEPLLIDAQRLKRWESLIAERVEASMFGAKKFKIHSLRLLRSNIAKSKTLHDLRQAVLLMIEPLQLYREHISLAQRTSVKQLAIDNKEVDQYIDSLLIEIESKDKLLAERKRVIDELLSVYSEEDSSLALLRNIENAKIEHKLNDDQASKMFGASRKQLKLLREKINLGN